MRLLSDSPAGRPSFELSEDQIATVVDLLCKGAANAHEFVTPGMLEVPITIQVRKAMLRLKKQLGFTNLQIIGEFELLDMNTNDPEVLGRIDIILKFLHQFEDEDAYLGVECKRVSPQDATLSQRYVSQGVDRFVSGQYAAGHHWGLMLGYVLHLPVANLVGDRRASAKTLRRICEDRNHPRSPSSAFAASRQPVAEHLWSDDPAAAYLR